MDVALGLLETTGFTPAIVALDDMLKAGDIEVIQAEINDFLGICIKVRGSVASVESALEAGRVTAEWMGGQPVVDVVNRVAREAERAIFSLPEFNPLIQQDVVHFPESNLSLSVQGDAVADSTSFALGFIETQGFTAVFDAIDTACKAASVEVVGKEKLGGGYVTVVIKGDVAAVTAAVDAGRQKVQGLGNLIAAHVIARPSPAMLALLPQVS